MNTRPVQAGWYENTFRRVLFPAYESGLRGRNTLRYLHHYERDQWLSADAIASLQWQRCKRLLEHCQRAVPYYREQWRTLGIDVTTFRDIGDLQRLPLLTKADIRANADAFMSETHRGGLLFKATGGSTGEPMRFGYTRESNDRRVAVMWRGYAWAGSRMGRRTLYLWGGAVGQPSRTHQLKDRLYNGLFARRMLDSFRMSESSMHAFADAIDRYRPDIVVGYVGPLVRLAEWLIATGRRIWQPQAIVCGAEALHGFQRDIIEQAFRGPAFNTYGCREFMLVAAECEHRDGMHINADHLVVETLGETGDVVITDLFNHGFPFVRYANGDMATRREDRCACGRGLPMLERVDGRVLDAIRTLRGHILPGEFFPHMLKDIPGVQQFQLVQRRLDRLDLSVVRGDAFDDTSIARIRHEVARVLGQDVELMIHLVPDIPLTASGKLRVTVSELAP